MPPIVVDAGALDLLPERVPGQVVITPHAGEMAKLLNRFETAASTAEHADSHEPYTADDVRLNRWPARSVPTSSPAPPYC